MYKFELYKDKKGETRFRFRAANGEVMFSSESYKSKASAVKAIDSIKKNAVEAPVEELAAAAKKAKAPAAAAKGASKAKAPAAAKSAGKAAPSKSKAATAAKAAPKVKAVAAKAASKPAAKKASAKAKASA